MASAKEETDDWMHTNSLSNSFMIPHKYVSKSYMDTFLKQLTIYRKNDVLCDVKIVTPEDNGSINV